MSKTLILAEKPSVAKEIARVLDCRKKAGGYIEGNRYIITWALGHLVTLAEPEHYGDEYKTWSLESLPMLPDKMDLTVIKQSKKQYRTVKDLMRRNDVSDLIIATDSGREGELVARWIIQKARFKKPMKRLWISSQTDKAIKEGIKSLKPSSEYDNLYFSAQSRAEADWLVGLNASRALTCKYNVPMTAGRVQTPTLAMIVAREEEIRKFVPRDYYNIVAKFNGIDLIWQDRDSGQTRTFDKGRADEVAFKVGTKAGTVIEVNKKSKKEAPPLAYDLTELQRDANRRFNYSAKQTSSLMQSLYEHHKIVTYPRTDSRHITEDIVPTLKERLHSVCIAEYADLVRRLLKTGMKITKRFVDNSKVTDHHAIIPTEQSADLGALSSEERNIYDLIVRRFLAVLYPPFEYEETTIKVESCREFFIAKGRIPVVRGWKAVYGRMERSEDDNDQDIKEQDLPDIKKGQNGTMASVRVIGKKTKPPSRYNEATLLSAMENPSSFIKSKDLKKTMDNAGGLGTPATRADIIEKLFNTFYIEKRGKDIFPTSKGTQIVDIVPKDLKSPELTAKWEQQLQLISKGIIRYKEFVNDMKKYSVKLVNDIISSSSTYRHDNITGEKCQCGKYLLEVKGKKGTMHVCQDRECGFRKVILQTSNARCPQCHKKLELRGDGDRRMFSCNCGHREKLSDFKKRSNEKANKRDINSFLRHQEKNKPANTPFADLLKK